MAPAEGRRALDIEALCEGDNRSLGSLGQSSWFEPVERVVFPQPRLLLPGAGIYAPGTWKYSMQCRSKVSNTTH